MPDKLLFIQRNDELKNEVHHYVDMSDKAINIMILFLHQNKGSFPKRRRSDFPKLMDEEIQTMEEVYKKIYNSICFTVMMY